MIVVKNRGFVGNQFLKIYLIDSNVPIFENPQRMQKHSTLLRRVGGEKEDGESDADDAEGI